MREYFFSLRNSFLHLFSVNLLQDMEMVISIIIQGKKKNKNSNIGYT